MFCLYVSKDDEERVASLSVPTPSAFRLASSITSAERADSVLSKEALSEAPSRLLTIKGASVHRCRLLKYVDEEAS